MSFGTATGTNIQLLLIWTWAYVEYMSQHGQKIINPQTMFQVKLSSLHNYIHYLIVKSIEHST